MTRTALRDGASERGERAADRADGEPTRDDGHAADAIHQPAGWKGGKGARGEEDRRPQPEDGLDAGDEDERDRRHCDGQL